MTFISSTIAWPPSSPAVFSLPTLPSKALLVTSIYLPMAKLILLNVSLGDQAEIERRNCGCPVEKLGWSTHLHSIRSFEKLTAGGMTFVDADLIRTLEEILPARFGGGPTDYQLVTAKRRTANHQFAFGCIRD